MTTQVDPVAAQAMQENIDNARNPDRRYIGNTGKRNQWVDTYENKTAEVKTQVSNTPNVRRGRQFDIGFQDTQAQGYEQRPRAGDTPKQQQLRSAVVKDQVSRGLEAQRPQGLQSGDRITANPTSKGRTRLYRQIGGQVFESGPSRTGWQIDSQVQRNGTVKTTKGNVVKMPDLKNLRRDLSQQVVKNRLSLIGGPFLQAVIQLDSILKGATGTGLFEHQTNEKAKAWDEISSWGSNWFGSK